ncbi:beta-lactamase/transpeptidase-like protein [Aspergillus crustosus]
MLVSLSSIAIANIEQLLEKSCAGSSPAVPSASAVLYGRDTNGSVELLYHSKTAECSPKNNNLTKDIFWLASCTKLVTGIACMQLVEQDKLRLDDTNQVETLCPELRDVKVLQDDGRLVEKARGITLRMLLTHTAGFGYSFLNDKLEKYNEFSGNLQDFQQHLVNQPGERFEYGISIDWAGILVERVTGMKLNNYLTQHVFLPLEVEDVSMIPSDHMRSRLVGLWQRASDGTLTPREYPLNKPLEDDNPEVFHSGGAGLFGSIREFGKILATLLNNGKSPLTGHQLLSPETVKAIFKNQLLDKPDFARRHLPAVNPELVYPAEELYPLCPPSKSQGWALGLGMISPGTTGRSDSTVHWSGLSNVYWWCDRENGVAGVVASQILPFPDPDVVGLWVQVETEVYKGLQRDQV